MHALSDSIFDIKDKLTDGEFKTIYDQMLKIFQAPTHTCCVEDWKYTIYGLWLTWFSVNFSFLWFIDTFKDCGCGHL